MRVAVQAGESAPVSAVKRAEQQSPGQPTTGSVTAGGDPEREFASDRRRQAQAARPGDGGGGGGAELEARRTRHLPRRCPRTLWRRRRSRSGRDGAPRTAFSRARRCEAGRASGRSYPNNRPGPRPKRLPRLPRSPSRREVRWCSVHGCHTGRRCPPSSTTPGLRPNSRRSPRFWIWPSRRRMPHAHTGERQRSSASCGRRS